MKKIVFFLAAIWIPMIVWSQKPTHTLTTETQKSGIYVYNNNYESIGGVEVRYDTVRITNYQLEEGETYRVGLSGLQYGQSNIFSESNNTYYYFVEWQLDGVSYSTSPEIQLTMGTSDMHLTAVMELTTKVPYSPVANWFEPTTGVLTLDEVRYGIDDAIIMSHNRYKFARDDVFSIVVKGEVNSYVAFSNFYAVLFDSEARTKPWNNLQTIDLSQTAMTGLSSSSNKITSLPALEHIVLGPNTQQIGYRAFYGLNIKTIDCYAATPPACTAGELLNTFDNMNVPKDEVLIRVPPQSVELYKQADGWKDFPNIQPLNDLGSVFVTIPTDVAEGYYDDMTVELTDLRSKAVLSRNILNKRRFQFDGMMRGSEYQATLRNAYGQVMGQSAPAELGEDDITLTISDLLQKKIVSLKVTLPDGTDVTGKVLVLWTDESGKTLGYASTLKAVAEGTKLSCKVTIAGELARQYVAPGAVLYTVKGEGENLLTVGLQPVQQLTLHGQVMDKRTGEPIVEATVVLTQQQEGTSNEFVTATTDEDGKYELQGTNKAGELSVTATGYLPATVEFSAPEADGALPSVALEPFNGVIVNTWLTYTEAAKEGEEGKVTDGFDDENGDVIYQVYNLSKNSSVTDFTFKGNSLYFPSGVEIGNYLLITVSSRGNHFSDVTEACQIGNSGTGLVTLSLLQKGGMEAKVTTNGSHPVMGVLYDVNGKFVRSNIYKSSGLSFSNLASGYYTLVSMTSNTLLRRVLLLSTFNDMGLVDGTDYVKNTVHVQDGRIATVNVTNVPELDMEKLRFTDSRTYFIADKNMINIGQFVTIQSKLYFAEQYAGRTGKVEFMLDLPEEIDFVENSALIGSTACSYRTENGHYIFPLDNLGYDVFRLFVLPKQEGEFSITGSVRFTLDGVQMVQPVGTVWVQAKGLTISAPVFVTPSTLRVSGTAPLTFQGKKVVVYDFDNLVGTTRVDGTGCWSVNVKFPAHKSTDLHAVKARMTLDSGAEIGETEVRYAVFSENIMAEKVVMVSPHEKVPVTFNYFENTISKKSYTYVLKKYWDIPFQGPWMAHISYSTKFTFLAYFKDLDIYKTDNVMIRVLASDGTSRALKAKYDATQKCYYASSDYPSSLKLPISAYAYAEEEYSPTSEEENASATKDVLAKLTEPAKNAAKNGEVEVLPGDEETFNMKFTVSGKTPYTFSTKEMDYDQAAEHALDYYPFISRNETDTFVYTFINGTDEAEMILLNVKEHVALRTVITYAEMDNLNGMPRKIVVSSKKKRPSPIDLANGWGRTMNIGSNILDVTGMKGYVDAIFLYDKNMRKRQRQLSKAIDSEVNKAIRQLESWCIEDDGARRTYSLEQIDYYENRINSMVNDYKDLVAQWEGTYDNIMHDLRRKAVWDVTWAAATSGALKALGAGMRAAGLVKTVEYMSPLEEAGRYAIGSTIKLGEDWLTQHYINPNIEELVSINFDRHYKEYEDKMNLQGESILRALKYINQEISDNSECDKTNIYNEGGDDEDKDEEDEEDEDEEEDDEEEDDDDVDYDDDDDNFLPPSRPLIDPNGYIYEAVPSNRVEGATATIFYKNGSDDVQWDAENYGQVNPQITKADGMYQWDVPQGQWQVRVQKDGYENNASEWLPVPPPQLDVNIPLIRARLPKVESAHAYKDAVAVKFDTYMQPALLTTEQITVKENGSAVAGTIELTDEEEAQAGVSYASKLRFVPATPFTATEVTLLISGQVANYAGIEMDEPYEEVLPIEGEVKSLEAEHGLKIYYQTTGIIRVKGTPAAAAAGKTVTVKCQSGIIASVAEAEVVLDANGEADVIVQGSLPGNEIVTFTMADPGLTTGTLVKVVQKTGFVVNAPMASVATETMVEIGTGITLTCSTEDAVIYFTLDGSSPVDSETRILYTGSPVVIYEETSLAAVAVVEGKGMSEVRVWHYTVPMTTQINDVQGSSIAVSPVRVQDAFAVTGMDGTFSVRVYSVTGKLLMQPNQVRNGQKVNVSALPTGIYLVVVNGEDSSFTQRIIKE